MYSVSARCRNSEASTIARRVTGLDGAEAWARLHANHNRRTLGIILTAKRECMRPKPAKDESSEASDHAVGRAMESHHI